MFICSLIQCLVYSSSMCDDIEVLWVEAWNRHRLNLKKFFYVISTLTVHVHGVETDWSYALAEFLASSLFRAFPGNPSNVTH